jgi:SAM-dependent methyltransferase
MAALPLTSSDTQAQQFWLDELGEGSRINEWCFSQFSKYLGHRILEIGCGTGTFTQLMGLSGAAVAGFDIEPSFIAVAKEATKHLPHVSVELGDVTKRRWSEDFDTVVALDVIEHIEDDLAILSALRDALAPGGKAIVKVPAMPGLHGTLDEVVGHYRRYSGASITAVMESAGFENVRVKHFNTLGIVGWWWNGSMLKRRTPPAGQVRLFERLLPLVRALDRVTPPEVGLSLIAVATRDRQDDT